jgi:glutaredoxin
MAEQTKLVELYTLSTCPWSRSAKAFLDDRRVKYDYVDYDLADAGEQARIREEMIGRAAAAFPFVKIGDEFIVGYNPDAFTRLLELETREDG